MEKVKKQISFKKEAKLSLKYILTVFLSQIELLSGITPFGPAIYSTNPNERLRLLTALCVLLGGIYRQQNFGVLKHISTILIITLVFNSLSKQKKKRSNVNASVCAITTFGTSFFFSFFTVSPFYGFIVASFEGILSFILVKILSKLKNIGKPKKQYRQSLDSSETYEKIASKVCKNCKRMGYCWTKEFNQTYKIMQKFEKLIEINGSISLDDVPSYFASRCLKISDFLFVTNTIYAINRLRYKKLNILTSVARDKKSGHIINGDSSFIKKLESGVCVLALSDGMGSGRRAFRESHTAMELLKEFLEAGFDARSTMALVNKALLSKNKEHFATIDLILIDLKTGEVSILKSGGSTTFIKRGEYVEEVSLNSLPTGILKEADIECTKRKFTGNELVVMVTDGVIESSQLDKKWVYNLLKKINTSNPQEIAEVILNVAKANYGGEIKDDMTVMVSRVS